jgi:DNA-binding LacI/PurR family transcriptional regulator
VPLRSKLNSRVTLADVAQACGYHLSTISLALRRHPEIPETTRLKIEQAAKELGYRPDPQLSALAAYRTRNRRTRYQCMIGVVTDYDRTDEWREYHTGQRIYEGMKRRAEELGYGLEEFTCGASPTALVRLERKLKARNCRCLVLPNVRRLGVDMGLDWENYSVITQAYSFQKPEFHRVAHHHRHNLALAVEVLRSRGYRRFGFSINPVLDQRLKRGWSAEFLSLAKHLGRGESAVTYMPKNQKEWSPDTVLKWLRREQPEVLISPGFDREHMEEDGWRVPAEIGFVNLDLAP